MIKIPVFAFYYLGLFKICSPPDYLKTRVKGVDDYDRENEKSDDFDLSR
jgi:hypothetical protein